MWRLFLVLICVISCGCRDEARPEVGDFPVAKPQAAVKLVVLVVDDNELVKGIGLLSGEWNERSGGELVVVESPLEKIADAKQLDADLVIYPSRLLGEFVSKDWLRPMRDSILRDEKLGWGDYLTAVRDQSVWYGGKVYALSFGEMPLVIGWKEKIPDPLPKTWKELDPLLSPPPRPLFDVTSGEGFYPLSAELFARVIASTAPSDRATLFFDPQSMKARLETPAIVQATEAILARSTDSSASASVAFPRNPQAKRLSPIPNSDAVFSATVDSWQTNEAPTPVVVLGFSGRLVSVTTSSRNAASAFQLVSWLVSGSTGTQLSQKSQATLWFRRSQVSQANRWFAEDADDQRGQELTAALSRGDAYLVPRIVGIESYLAALEQALSKAIAEGQSANAALQAVSDEWNKLTESLGQEDQLRAFNRHLGLSE